MGLLTEGFYALFSNANREKTDEVRETQEGLISEELPELELSMDDEELLELSKKWESRWGPYRAQLQEIWDANEDYWKGTQFAGNEYLPNKRALVDNLIFQALETFIPVATRERPDPVVETDNTPEGQSLADKIRRMLIARADAIKFRLKLKKLIRFWALYRLGIAKVGWSIEDNDFVMSVIRPHKLVLDPEAGIEDCEYSGDYLGEYRKDTAEQLIKRFPKKKDFITKLVRGSMGTSLQYVEWWTNEYVFWTMEKEVLGKSKNPHWNYQGEKEVVDEYGVTQKEKVEGSNHFPFPKKPYIFLSVFNLGLHPYDETSLIEQNLAIQDLINKRLRQIDKNADAANNGVLVSGEHFTKEQASAMATALKNGGTVWVPSGSVLDAVNRLPSPPLPSFVYESLQDYRQQLLSVFGVTGVSPQGLQKEDSVRGKIMVQSQDTERIGGGMNEHIEQFADSVYNWFVQLMFVYYDEPHAASVIGEENAREYIVLHNSDFDRKINVSVSDGSTIPKDPLTKANQAVDLWGAGALDPVTLYTQLDYPNPRETAEKLVAWKSGALLGNQMPQQSPNPNGVNPEMPNTQPEQPEGLAATPSLSQVPIQ